MLPLILLAIAVWWFFPKTVNATIEIIDDEVSGTFRRKDGAVIDYEAIPGEHKGQGNGWVPDNWHTQSV